MFILQLRNTHGWYQFYTYPSREEAIYAAGHWGAVLSEHARVLDESGMVIYDGL